MGILSISSTVTREAWYLGEESCPQHPIRRGITAQARRNKKRPSPKNRSGAVLGRKIFTDIEHHIRRAQRNRPPGGREANLASANASTVRMLPLVLASARRVDVNVVDGGSPRTHAKPVPGCTWAVQLPVSEHPGSALALDVDAEAIVPTGPVAFVVTTIL